MPTKSLRVLLVEDSADNAALLLHDLGRGGFEPTALRVETADRFRAAVADEPWDVILCDDSLSEFDASQALDILRQLGADVPLIVVSGTIEEERAVELIRAGAADYLMKDRLSRLCPAVEREVRQAVERRERRRAEREARGLAAIVASSDDAIVGKTLDGTVTSWNAGAERLYGYAAGEIVGHSTSPLISPDRPDEEADLLRRVARGERVEHFETERVRKDGTRVHVSVTLSPVRDDAGEVVGASAIARDITRRKQADERQARDALLLANVRDAVIVTDVDGIVTYWNDGATRLFGWTAAEIVGRPYADRYPEPERTVVADGIRKRVAGEEWAGKYESRRKDGSRVWIDARVGPITDTAGNVVGVLGLSHDITDHRRAETALREKEAKLAEAVRVARMGYWNRDLATGDLDWSDELYDIFGVDPAGFGRTLESFLACVVPDDRQAVREGIAGAEKSGGAFDHTYRVLVRGEVRVIHEVGRVTMPDGERTGRVTGTAQDVTARERAKAELRASEYRYRTLLERIPEPLFVYDRETLGYLAVNDAAVASYGYTRDEFLAMTLRDISPAGDVPALLDMLASSPGGFEHRGRWRHRKKDGTVFDVEITAHDLDLAGRPACIALARDVTASLLAEQALQLRDRAIQAVAGGILITEATAPDNPISYVSPGFTQLTGYAVAEAIGRNCRFLQGKDTDRAAVAEVREAVREGRACGVELLNYCKDGTPFWNALSISPVRDKAGRLTHFIGVQTDVTGRRKLEEQFRQAQKMEAVGQLAGGVAHDFNNLLTVINGYGEIVHNAISPGHPSRELVAEITRAGERAAGLTRQLLAFSRRAVLEPKVLDPNALIRDVETMLRRLIGEDIDLATRLAPDIGRVKTDPGQLEQAVVNLCVNARDAMPQGGKITVETRNIELDAAYAATRPDVRPGPYVVLAVSDTGTGMTPEVQARIFEPFFTTKEQGKGTGLGLAMVFGFVKQSGGHVAVYSEPGRGTTFKLYLPLVGDAPLAGKSGALRTPTPMPRGTETVLLVEDEDAVRALGRHVLVMCGYTVLVAGNGREAVKAADGHAGPLHLLLTDVVMPGGMGGRQVAEAVVARRPGTKVLFTSGYTDDAVVRHGVLDEGTHFLQKPFTPAALAQKVRDVLDETSGGVGA